MIIETSQLQTLLAISTTGSFSKAAQKLNVTQSAISQSVKNLEKKVGVQLLKEVERKSILQKKEKSFIHSLILFLEKWMLL